MLDKYYIDYYDMNDGWLGWSYIEEFRKDRIFTDYDEANRVRDKLNNEMPFGNVRCGEHYEVRQVPETIKIGNLCQQQFTQYRI